MNIKSSKKGFGTLIALIISAGIIITISDCLTPKDQDTYICDIILVRGETNRIIINDLSGVVLTENGSFTFEKDNITEIFDISQHPKKYFINGTVKNIHDSSLFRIMIITTFFDDHLNVITSLPTFINFLPNGYTHSFSVNITNYIENFYSIKTFEFYVFSQPVDTFEYYEWPRI
jgi:hypothetical protein